MLPFYFLPLSVKAGTWELASEEIDKGDPVYIRKTVQDESGQRVSLHLCKFSTDDYTLQVVDQGSDQENRKYSNLRDAMEKNGCVAGLNGGFYGKDYQPLGVVYENGKKVAPFSSSTRRGLASGVIWSGSGGIHIVRLNEFKGGAGVRQAIQTGPMLISQSKPVSGLSREKRSLRSFVLTDWKGTWMLGTSSSVSLGDLADILHSPRVFQTISVNRAINLDGGRSSAFFLKQQTGNQSVYRTEFARVRNFLGIIPKN